MIGGSDLLWLMIILIGHCTTVTTTSTSAVFVPVRIPNSRREKPAHALTRLTL